MAGVKSANFEGFPSIHERLYGTADSAEEQ